uniref:Uncharacterized protein n=1 Tax=Arundo donax TaxID=35708 RepID=A0A0A9E055_ARUDO
MIHHAHIFPSQTQPKNKPPLAPQTKLAYAAKNSSSKLYASSTCGSCKLQRASFSCVRHAIDNDGHRTT